MGREPACPEERYIRRWINEEIERKKIEREASSICVFLVVVSLVAMFAIGFFSSMVDSIGPWLEVVAPRIYHLIPT